jgi:hypothetical protein
MGCSSTPPPFSGCGKGPLVSILVGDEHLYGVAMIGAQQDIAGTGTLDVIICGTSGEHDEWRLDVRASSYAPSDAAPPPALPLTSTDELDAPSTGITAYAMTNVSAYGPVKSAQIIASAGHIHGSAVDADAGVATFDGAYTFSCSTNEPDPNFLTTFCKQFEALAPP